jgi:two-component system, NarL family, response regulator YdfI
MTRVLIVASSAIVRAGLEALLGAGPALEVVGSLATLDVMGARIESDRPDVLLIDVAGNEALPAFPVGPDILPVVLLTAGPDGMRTEKTLRRGVRAVLPRESSAEEIRTAVEAAGAGLLVLHPDVTGFLVPLLASSARASEEPRGEPLTPREVEVLSLLAEGAGNKLIAHRLGISEHTVKFHVGSILAKLNASSRTEAVTLGVRQGLILL